MQSSYLFVVDDMDIERIKDDKDKDEVAQGMLKTDLLLRSVTIN